VLSAHPVKSQGRPRTTSSSQLIGQNGLPVRVSLRHPLFPEAPCSRWGRTAVSCPDNGNAYRSTIHALACRTLGIKHSRTRPYRPRTNGKAERFIRTLLGGWAYGAVYHSSAERAAALPGWLDLYNRRRPHGGLSHQPPMSRLLQFTNNVSGSYS